MKKLIVILIIVNIFLFSTISDAYAHVDDLDFYEAFENHGSIMLIIDSQTGNILHVNEAASNFYGYSIGTLESMNIQDLNNLSPEESKKRCKKLQTKINMTLFLTINWQVERANKIVSLY